MFCRQFCYQLHNVVGYDEDMRRSSTIMLPDKRRRRFRFLFGALLVATGMTIVAALSPAGTNLAVVMLLFSGWVAAVVELLGRPKSPPPPTH